MRRTFQYNVLKALAIQAVFVVLHFAYQWLPVPLVAVFSGLSEGVFQHMKIAFFSYSLICLVEYGWIGRRMKTRDSFFYSRLMMSIFTPWGMFIWYLAPAVLHAPLSGNALEILYANLVLFLVLLAFSTLEADFQEVHFSKGSKVVLVLFYGLFVFLMIAFTFSTPWAGFFVQ